MKTQVSFVRGEESDTGGGDAEILVTVNDSLLSSAVLSLRPLDRELNRPSLSCGWKAAGAVWVPERCVCLCVPISLGLHCRDPRGVGRWALPWCLFLL